MCLSFVHATLSFLAPDFSIILLSVEILALKHYWFSCSRIDIQALRMIFILKIYVFCSIKLFSMRLSLWLAMLPFSVVYLSFLVQTSSLRKCRSNIICINSPILLWIFLFTWSTIPKESHWQFSDNIYFSTKIECLREGNWDWASLRASRDAWW